MSREPHAAIVGHIDIRILSGGAVTEDRAAKRLNRFALSLQCPGASRWKSRLRPARSVGRSVQRRCACSGFDLSSRTGNGAAENEGRNDKSIETTRQPCSANSLSRLIKYAV